MTSSTELSWDRFVTRYWLGVSIVLLLLAFGVARVIGGWRPSVESEFPSILGTTTRLAMRFAALSLVVWFTMGARASASVARASIVVVGLLYAPLLALLLAARTNATSLVNGRSVFTGVEVTSLGHAISALVVLLALSPLLAASGQTPAARLLPPRPIRTMFLGLIAIAAAALTMFLVRAATMLPLVPDLASLPLRIIPPSGDWTRHVLKLAATLVHAPIVEEVLFRGFLQRRLQAEMPRWGCVAVSAVAFAFAHDPMEPFLVFSGLLCALSYERTGTLLAPVLAHLALNMASAAGALGEYWILTR